MFSSLLWLASLLMHTYSFETHTPSKQQPHAPAYFNQLSHPISYCKAYQLPPIETIAQFLRRPQWGMSPSVIHKVISTLECVQKYDVNHNEILTVIDYSLPSSKKRLWVFDLKNMTLLYHTYVSHGVTSGTLFTENFSNRYNSKASSLGVYRTMGSYYGRQGYSLRLQGLDRGFNDNAERRYIVMHGGWYMDESFIKKYGRPGRSWGCPALPESLTRGIIQTIKDNSLLIAYYPSDQWFLSSKYLNCKSYCSPSLVSQLKTDIDVPKPFEPERAPVLFADQNSDSARTENEPIIAINANVYQTIFNAKPPLKRMLRRQIGTDEYIALTYEELKQFVQESPEQASEKYAQLYFIVPLVKHVRGYYETEMHPLKLGTITHITVPHEKEQPVIIEFDSHAPLKLRSTGRFIRWLGL